MVRVLGTGVVTLLGAALLTGAVSSEESKAKELTIAKALEATEWTLTGVDQRKRTVSIYDTFVPPDLLKAPGVPPRMMTKEKEHFQTGLGVAGLPVAADATVTVDGKAAKLEDLKRGMRVSVRLGEKGDQVTGLEAKSKNDGRKGAPVWKLVAADAKKGTFSVRSDEKQLTMKDIPLAEEAKVHVFVPEKARDGFAVRQMTETLGGLTVGKPLYAELRMEKGKIVAADVVGNK